MAKTKAASPDTDTLLTNLADVFKLVGQKKGVVLFDPNSKQIRGMACVLSDAAEAFNAIAARLGSSLRMGKPTP